MLHKTRAIVLHSIKHGESGIISQMYTETLGRQSYLIHGVRKQKSKTNAYLFQPLSLLSLVAYLKENRQLGLVKEAKPDIILQNLHFDIRKSTITMFLGEVLYKVLRESQPDENLFNYIYHAVQALDISEKGVENFHLVFLVQLTKFIGISPKNNTEIEKYGHSQGVSIIDLLSLSISDLQQIKLNGMQRSELLGHIIRYYEYHQEGIGKIHSLQILREVFH